MRHDVLQPACELPETFADVEPLTADFDYCPERRGGSRAVCGVAAEAVSRNASEEERFSLATLAQEGAIFLQDGQVGHFFWCDQAGRSK